MNSTGCPGEKRLQGIKVFGKKETNVQTTNSPTQWYMKKYCHLKNILLGKMKQKTKRILEINSKLVQIKFSTKYKRLKIYCRKERELRINVVEILPSKQQLKKEETDKRKKWKEIIKKTIMRVDQSRRLCMQGTGHSVTCLRDRFICQVQACRCSEYKIRRSSCMCPESRTQVQQRNSNRLPKWHWSNTKRDTSNILRPCYFDLRTQYPAKLSNTREQTRS